MVNPRRRERGFTALELLLVLVISALLLLTAVPALQEWSEDKRMSAAMGRLHTDLNLARREAIVRNVSVAVCPGDRETGCSAQPAWHLGWLLFEDRNLDRDWQPGETLVSAGNSAEFLTARSATSRRVIRFSPSGAAPASNASIEFCDRRGPDEGRRLVISNTGRIRRAPLDAGDATPCNM